MVQERIGVQPNGADEILAAGYGDSYIFSLMAIPHISPGVTQRRNIRRVPRRSPRTRAIEAGLAETRRLLCALLVRFLV
jgi:hypothetical protein